MDNTLSRETPSTPASRRVANHGLPTPSPTPQKLSPQQLQRVNLEVWRKLRATLDKGEACDAAALQRMMAVHKFSASIEYYQRLLQRWYTIGRLVDHEVSLADVPNRKSPTTSQGIQGGMTPGYDQQGNTQFTPSTMIVTAIANARANGRTSESGHVHTRRDSQDAFKAPSPPPQFEKEEMVICCQCLARHPTFHSIEQLGRMTKGELVLLSPGIFARGVPLLISCIMPECDSHNVDTCTRCVHLTVKTPVNLADEQRVKGGMWKMADPEIEPVDLDALGRKLDMLGYPKQGRTAFGRGLAPAS